MNMIVPPECQGQMQEVSYGGDGTGTVWRRVYDRSDHSESWSRAEYTDLFPDCAHTDGCCAHWSPQNSAPGGDPDAWEPCAEPKDE